MQFVMLMAFSALVAIANDTDKIFFHNGKVVEGRVVKLEEFTVVFKYAGEDAEQTVSKLAIDNIIYKSGREEEISEKIVVSSKADWEKVEVLIDKSQLVGWTKVAEVLGKTTGFSAEYTTAAGTDKSSKRKMPEAAAEMGCSSVYINADKEIKGGMESRSFGAQGNKKGSTFRY